MSEAATSEAPAHMREIVQDIVQTHAGRKGPLLPILNDVQDAFSFIPSAAVPLIAQLLNLTRAEVFGVVSFYHDYRAEPAGRHVIKVCRAEACQAMGGRDIADRMQALLGADWHEMSADGAVTLEASYCLGLCAMAPAVMVDGTPHGRVTGKRAEELVKECRQ